MKLLVAWLLAGFAGAALAADSNRFFPLAIEEAAVVLKPGTRIGGIVRAQNGRLLARAKVEVLGLRRDVAGQVTLSRLDEVTTDREGKCKTEAVPKDFADLTFQVTHPEFRPREFELGDDAPTGR